MNIGGIELSLAALLLILSQIGMYFVLRYRVSMLEKNFVTHDVNDAQKHTNDNKRIDAGFKKIDSLSDKIIVLEQDTKFHLDLETAEAKFITRKELELHLEKIEIVTGSTNNQVKLLMGKQDDILDALAALSKDK